MALMVPIISTTLGIAPERLKGILAGLASGEYERIGGVIRRSDTKRIVAWLRTSGDLRWPYPWPFGPLMNMMRMAVATNVVSLSLTAISVEHIRRKIALIEQGLKQISAQIARLERKLDLEYAAQLRGALNQAQLALSMDLVENKRDSAIQAIERLITAEQLHLALLGAAFEEELSAAPPLLQGVALSYVAAARCMIVLNEPENARKHLEDGGRAVCEAANRLYAKIIEPSRTLLLRPELTESISLNRLVNLAHMAGKSLSESEMFDEVRGDLWTAAKLDFVQHARAGTLPNEDAQATGSYLRSIWTSSTAKQGERSQIVERVCRLVDDVESVLETSNRVQGLALEMDFLKENGISFDEWNRLPMSGQEAEDGLVWLLPENGSVESEASTE